jgi:hypothetical protein
MKVQKCTECDKRSLPGLKAGKGKCQYHWNVGVWGKQWADRVLAEVRDFSKPKEA